MRRGDILLADLGEPLGHEQAFQRPVLVVSAPPWFASNPPVIAVLPITRTNRESPTHVELEPGKTGLRATNYAKCEDIRAISPQRMLRRFGRGDDVAHRPHPSSAARPLVPQSTPARPNRITQLR